ncbi:MAG: XdhC family protein [Anaerolineales bacterium]|nr:XdhC family protein [Anaerolineales bacterium]
MDDIFKQISELIAAQKSAAFCVIVSASGSTPRGAGSKMLVFPDGQISGTIGGGELEQRVIEVGLQVIADGTPQVVSYSMADPERGDPGVCGGQLEIYVEPITPPPTVIVVGAGHVGRQVAVLAKWLGYAVVVSDDREEFLTDPELADVGRFHSGLLETLPEAITIHSQSFIVLTTRNVELDVAGLPALLAANPAYIGVIGSRRRWETTKAKLREAGVSAKQLASIQSPIGLDLQGETPQEIALSIMAQITMLRHGGEGGQMAN